MVYRGSDDNRPVGALGIFKGDFRLGKGFVVKVVKVDVISVSTGCINQSVGIDKSEFFKTVKLLHAGLV